MNISIIRVYLIHTGTFIFSVGINKSGHIFSTLYHSVRNVKLFRNLTLTGLYHPPSLVHLNYKDKNILMYKAMSFFLHEQRPLHVFVHEHLHNFLHIFEIGYWVVQFTINCPSYISHPHSSGEGNWGFGTNDWPYTIAPWKTALSMCW